MSDPRNHVRPGQRLSLAASQINYLNGLMRNRQASQEEPLRNWSMPTAIAMVRNTTAFPVPRWGVLALTGIVVDPTESDAKRRQFEQMPCLAGVAPWDGKGLNSIGIAVEPVAAGAIGRFAVSGMFPCRVKTTGNAIPPYARGRAGDVTQLIASNCGPVKLLWIELAGAGDGRWAVGVM